MTPRCAPSPVFAVRLVCTLVLALFAGQTSLACTLDGGENRTVTRVVDGETFLIDGGGEVRLAGALAPTAYDAAGRASDWPPAAAARDALDSLLAGRTVTLRYLGRRTDRHGRLLAQVFAPAASGTPETWVQGWMLRAGHARAYALEATSPCARELVAHEAAGRQSNLGLWADPIYAPRRAEDVTALLRLAGTFQIVEGRIAAAAEVRDILYLNFGDDRRQDFTVLVRPQARRAMITAGLKAETLEGVAIRVRGWIERRGGPLIEIQNAALLEIIPITEAESPRPPRRRARRAPTPQP